MDLTLTAPQFYLALGVVVGVAGLVRLLLAQDPVARLIAMNVLGSGSLLVLLALAARGEGIDPVLSALVLTGLVITVAFTGVGAVLIRRIEGPDPEEDIERTDEHRGSRPSPAGGGEEG